MPCQTAQADFFLMSTTGLRNFVDFLRQCSTAKRNIQALKCLNDESENIELMKKLPPWLNRQWRRKVSAHCEATGEFPAFEEFIDFLAQEDKIAHDPLSRSWQKEEGGTKEKRKGTSFLLDSRHPTGFPGTGVGRSFGACKFCKENHSLHSCEVFGKNPFETRERFVIENKLCFACLNSGHRFRDCKNRKSCEICQGGHPTNMHRTVPQPEDRGPTIPITACASRSSSRKMLHKSSMVLLVKISDASNPDKELILYAMLDTQSDCSFVTEGAAEAMGLQGVTTRLSLSTMTASDKVVSCQRYEGLRVQGLTSGHIIALPPVHSRRKIPINYHHIPCPEMVDGWPHLRHLRDKIAATMNAEVGLLLGYDCPKA